MALLLLQALLRGEEMPSVSSRARLRGWPCLEEVPGVSPSATGRLHFSSTVGTGASSSETPSTGVLLSDAEVRS